MKRLILLSLFITAPLYAIKGEYASSEFELPQSCRLTIPITQNGEEKWGLCSGTYVGNKTFVTAEHCHKYIIQSSTSGAKELPYFQCPGIEKKFPLNLEALYPMRDTKHKERLDIAIIKVEEDIDGLRPMILPTSKEEVEELIAKNENCYINGYGIDNDNKSGTLRAAKTVNISKSTSIIYQTSTQSMTLRENYTQNGDSGGAMYCINSSGEKIFVGVSDAGKKDFSTVEKISSILDWINNAKSSDTFDSEKFNALLEVQNSCVDLSKCILAKNNTALTRDIAAIIEKASLSLKNEGEKNVDELYKIVDNLNRQLLDLGCP